MPPKTRIPTPELHRLASSLGRKTVEIADETLKAIPLDVPGDARLVRLNLCAYVAHWIGWFGADSMVEEQALEFGPLLCRGTAGALAAEHSAERLARMFSSRCLGYLHAIREAEQCQSFDPLARYFLACCSVNRVEVLFDSIAPDVRSLELLGDALTEAGRALLERVRAMDNPATYPLDHELLFNVSLYLKAVMEQLRQRLAPKA